MSRSPGTSSVTSTLPIEMLPAVISSSPAIIRRSVVLPQPDGPTSTMNSPSAIVRLTSSTARTPPANSLTMCSSSIWAMARNILPDSALCNRCHIGHPAITVAAMEVAPDVLLVRDTCNVYVLRAGREAVLVDFGGGLVLDRLDELGVDRVTDVLVTHHHRDQVQGLARAAEHGAR